MLAGRQVFLPSGLATGVRHLNESVPGTQNSLLRFAQSFWEHSQALDALSGLPLWVALSSFVEWRASHLL